jgi:16S rRNA (cytosine967-C5)-methyltransferase
MTSPAEIRAQAARIVTQVNVQGASLDVLLANTGGTPQERGLLRSLCYGTIRWQLRLEAALDRMSSRPQSELDPEIRALALIGLFQLLHTDIAAHAAVAETVEGTRALKQPRAAGLVNAVLRRCLREKEQLSASIDGDIATRTAHPKWLVDCLARDWPNRFAAILDANNAHPPLWLRVNARRTSVTHYLERLEAAGYSATRSAFAPDALLLSTPVDVRSLPGFDQGDVSVQDAAAQLAARLLAPRAGDRVLDACAAPGGKTCHMLELEPAIAELLAIDISAERLERVHENLNRLHLSAAVQVADAADPETWSQGRQFERILLDVPCSATGVIRRHPDIKLLRRPQDIPELARRQADMLRRIWAVLAPGGRLLYASCSALKAETSEVVGEFLADHPQAADVTKTACAAAGFELDSLGTKGVYASPGLAISAGEAQMDGFYYACLEKNG